MAAVLCTPVFLEWLSRLRLGDYRCSRSAHLFGAELLHTLRIVSESDRKQNSSNLTCHGIVIPLVQTESTQTNRQSKGTHRSWSSNPGDNYQLQCLVNRVPFTLRP